MQWKSERGRILFCTLLLVVLLTGCRPTAALLDAPPAPYQGISLRIACPNEATTAILQRHGQPWALRQGAKVQVLRYDSAQGPQSAGQADVWIVAPAELPRWAAGQLAAVPESFTARDNPYAWTNLLPTYREQMVSWEKTPYGWPLIGESPVCCYRADLLGDPVHQTAFRKQFDRELDAPSTWETFALIAEYFRAHGPDGRAAPSLPPLPRADADLDRLFYTVAASFARRAVASNDAPRADGQDDVFSFHYDVKTGQPRIDAPGFVYALKLLQRLQACRSVEPDDHPEAAFRDGRAVLCLTDAPWLKTFQKTPLRDKIGVCRVPGGDRVFDFATGKSEARPKGNRVPYLGGVGWFAVVPRAGEHAEAAFDLLADLSGPKTSTQIFLGAIDRGGPTRTEQLLRDRWDSFDVDAARTLQLRTALQDTLLHRGLKNPVLCLRTPRQAAHRAALVKRVRAALLDGTDAAKALREVAEDWRKLDREQGLDAHLADYRRSLGLLAKR